MAMPELKWAIHQLDVRFCLEVRSIKDQAHEYSSESAGHGDSGDPCEEEEANSLKVDSLQGAVAEANTDGSASDAHRGRDGKRVLREDEDGEGGAHLHRGTWRKEQSQRMPCGPRGKASNLY